MRRGAQRAKTERVGNKMVSERGIDRDTVRGMERMRGIPEFNSFAVMQ